MTPFRLVLRHPTLRLIATALLVLGGLNASVYPYQSLIAIERFGMSKPAFSLMLALASVIAVVSSVVLGILGDQFGHRRVIAIGTTLCSTIGIGLILAFPGIWALVLCLGVLLPMASSMYGQLFALARLASPDEGATRDGILGVIRAALSFSFLSMLIFWTFAFGYGLSEMAVFVSGGIASLGLLGLIVFGWPKDGQTPWADPRSGMRLRDALAEIVKPRVAVRVLFIGAIASSGTGLLNIGSGVAATLSGTDTSRTLILSGTNTADNVIPARAVAKVNIRYNDVHSSLSLSTWLRAEAARVTEETDVSFQVGVDVWGESFVTQPGPLVDLVAAAVRAETGLSPQLSTTGGTSDARFIRSYCPVVEFGLVGKTMHQVDERVEVTQITGLKAIYTRILDDYFAPLLPNFHDKSEKTGD